MKFIDLSGKRFGKWLAVRRVLGRSRWLCRCDCGAEKIVFTENLRSGHSKSCRACCANSQITHGGAKRGEKNPSYFAWKHMMYRCYNSKHHNFSNYGARGITVCKEWHDFQKFFADMGEQPAGLTLERLDNGGNYRRTNCAWGTHKAQNRNKRTNVIVKFDGASKCISEWAEDYSMPYNAVWKRLKAGWPIDRALTEPLHTR